MNRLEDTDHNARRRAQRLLDPARLTARPQAADHIESDVITDPEIARRLRMGPAGEEMASRDVSVVLLTVVGPDKASAI